MKTSCTSGACASVVTALALATLTLSPLHPVQAADPLITSWLTTYSGAYARVYTNDAARAARSSATTWSNGSQTQAQPA